jgi:selenocysteine lyase/cysteine desulfurase
MAETPLPRGQFPVTEHCIYLNNAGIGPLPIGAVDAIVSSAAAFRDQGGLAFDDQEAGAEHVRSSGARLLGVPATDVAFVKNTTEGLSFAASGIDWKPGDRVIVPDYEFPSNVYPWTALRDHGVDVELLEPVGPRRELPLELFDHALRGGRTRVMAVSWVQFGYGWRSDLAALGALCREHGTLLCVDAIQGLGVLPARFHEWGVDVASTDAHKWMLGPHGIGLVSLSPHAREQLRPLQPGWASVAHRDDYDNLDLVFDDSARAFEGGTANLITIAGMGASIDLLLEAGLDQVWAHVDALCQRLASGLTDLGAELRSVHDSDHRSGIVSFVLPGRDVEAAVAALEAKAIIGRTRAGAIRLSPHGYNTIDEIDATIEAIGAL